MRYNYELKFDDAKTRNLIENCFKDRPNKFLKI